MKALLVSIYTCTANKSEVNLLNGYRRAYLIGPGVEGPHTMPEDLSAATYPVVKLVREKINDREYLKVIPVDIEGTVIQFGGNFVYSSDTRFQEINRYPIPIHDRRES